MGLVGCWGEDPDPEPSESGLGEVSWAQLSPLQASPSLSENWGL